MTQNNKNANAFSFALPFTAVAKTRGASDAAGKTATFNAKTRRLTLGAYYYNAGYRAAAVGLDDNGRVVVALTKQRYSATTSALHATQHFVTVVKNSPALEKLSSARKHAVLTDEKNPALLYLAPAKTS